MTLGARFLGEGRCAFLVWAPKARRVDVQLVHPETRSVPLAADDRGYFYAVVDGAGPGTRYFYLLDETTRRPDPASRFQPEGVHGPSEVIAPEFAWHDRQWQGRPLCEYVIYELHVGAFTSEGTFDAVIPHLDDLMRLGITVLELMPIAQFPGTRNWGYDGVYSFAAQNSYGGPDGLRRLVDACHQRGLGVALDVVYNHLGPEGNYLDDFGPYFTDRYRTPWGPAVNVDGRSADEVRRYFRDNALSWITDFHVDALRLDAVHAIFDQSARPFLRELQEAVQERAVQLGRRVAVIAESNQNDARLVESPTIGGFGLDAVWCDDFHHALHVLLTGEQSGYYADFGGVAQLAKALAEGFVYTGEYSRYRGRRHGVSAARIPAERFVVCAQNHDQVGNRALGERLTAITDWESLKLAAGIVLSSPHIPLLFMGEEYGETAPFLYFVSHSDADLVEAVRRGRRQEFASFPWSDAVADPQAESTFRRSRLQRELRNHPRHAALRRFYAELLRLRKSLPALARPNKQALEVVTEAAAGTLLMRRWDGSSAAAVVCQFGESRTWDAPLPAGRWRVLLDSADARWQGPGSRIGGPFVSAGRVPLALQARQFVLLAREEGD
jgi:maltooligosyltrehalose trehalohydrolase